MTVLVWETRLEELRLFSKELELTTQRLAQGSHWGISSQPLSRCLLRESALGEYDDQHYTCENPQ